MPTNTTEEEKILPELLNRPSEEISEIVEYTPKGIVRWSNVIFTAVLILFFATGFLLRYSDMLTGTFTLSASNAPKSVISRTDGKLFKILHKENTHVKENEILAYLESTASHEEVIKLSDDLEKLWSTIREDKWMQLTHQPAAYKNLGELQSAYQVFIASYIGLKAYLSDGMYARKKELLQREIKNYQELVNKLEEQRNIYAQNKQLASEDFSVKEQLYQEKVIPLLEYKQEKSKYLEKALPISNTEISIINNITSTEDKKQELLQLEQQFTDQKSNFLQALNTLISQVEEWKKKYLLRAPVAGTISWPVLLQEKQDVKTGEELFYISSDSTGYYGEVLISQDNSGKIKIGQAVIISLSGFPYQEFGKLHGVVSFVSAFPDKNKQYYIGVKLDNKLVTDLNREITYRNGLSGSADIITAKTRLINKLLYSIRQVLDKAR